MSGCLTMLTSGGGRLVQISDQSISSNQTVTATAGYRLTSAGSAQKREQNTYTTLETWLLAGSAGDYEVRATLQSGTLTTGTLNTWQPLSSDREWFNQDPSSDESPVNGTLLIEIRITSGTVLDSATITLSADREVA